MKAWLRIFVPLALIIGVAFAFHAHFESQRELEALVEHEQAQLRMAELRLGEMLAGAAVDQRIMARAPALHDYLAGEPGSRAALEALFAAFIDEDWTYERLRLIDSNYRERLHVERTFEGARARPDAELAERGASDPQQMLALAPGQVHVTRMELGVDNGKIEIPRRPVLQLASRLAPGTDDAGFVLMSTLRGAVLLKSLRDSVSTTDDEFWLLDQDGYWLMHPDPAMRWGRQLDASRRVQQRMPALAVQLQNASGSVRIDGALYVHRRIRPLERPAVEGLVDASPVFDLVSRMPPERLPAAVRADLWLPLAALLSLAAVGSALLSRTQQRSLAAEQRELRLLQEGAAAGELRAWIQERIYRLSLKIHAARDAQDFASAVLAELAPVLGLAAARFYALRDGCAHPIADFGLPPQFECRDFAPGEGLVGEAIRSGKPMRLHPPAPGYLDLGGGLGEAPVADLRILPLQIHDRAVGALELALLHPLGPREEEFLGQALPLLALNLDQRSL